MRVVALGLVVASVTLAGCVDPFTASKERQTEALQQNKYTRDIEVSVSTLMFVFGQADESLRAVNQGWLASEGAASQFRFLHEQVKQVKDEMTARQPPPKYDQFHRQLGRSVSLTQQAMDSMHAGFTSGDGTYFTLAQEKLSEARVVLHSAVNAL